MQDQLKSLYLEQLFLQSGGLEIDFFLPITHKQHSFKLASGLWESKEHSVLPPQNSQEENQVLDSDSPSTQVIFVDTWNYHLMKDPCMR